MTSSDFTMSLDEKDKRMAYNIVRHLQSQASTGVLDQDGKGGVESKTFLVSTPLMDSL